ncbi:hypothetical protein BH11BAC5_BH11BAC5_50050 [soil metagenome]
MRELISQRRAIDILLAIFTAVLLFHTMVLTKVLSYAFVWAGNINSEKEMKILEGISIIINVFAILILVLKGEYIKHNISEKILNIIIWTLVFFFSLSTIGNLFAKSKFELYFFTPLTLISAILCLRIVIGQRPSR